MDVSTLAHVVQASCVLHNIFDALKNEFIPDWADAEVLIEEPILPIDETPAPDAKLFRDALAEYFTNVSNHSPYCANVQTVTQETSQETTKAYTSIFYRTVQYLRMVLRHNPGYNQMESNEFSTEEVERRGSNENSGAFNPTHSCDKEMGTSISERNKHSCTLGMNNVTLRLKQGEFIAIIGILGSGKTALLRLLSGRLKCECGQEHLNVNGTGHDEIHNSYSKKTVFLSQFMLRYDGEVTVRQYLFLAALMKMPRNTKNMAKFERVEQIISM
ncbi:ABC transporter G family member 2, partial [Paramuricea clavata]